MTIGAEELLQRRDRWLAMADQAPTEALRVQLLNIARLFEVEIELTHRAHECLCESKELIARVDSLLVRRPSVKRELDQGGSIFS